MGREGGVGYPLERGEISGAEAPAEDVEALRAGGGVSGEAEHLGVKESINIGAGLLHNNSWLRSRLGYFNEHETNGSSNGIKLQDLTVDYGRDFLRFLKQRRTPYINLMWPKEMGRGKVRQEID
jgi:hypothetical protein